MHIVVDGGTWANRRGYGRFTREILAAAAAGSASHRFTLVADPSVARDAVPPAIRLVHVSLETPPGVAAAASGHRSARDLWRVSRALAAEDAECLFFPSVYTYVPVATRKPVVVGIHDVIPERFPAHVFPSRRARWFWTMKTRAAIAQAARVVTVSEHARDGLVGLLGIPRARIRVVSEAPSQAFAPEADVTAARAAIAAAGLPADAQFLLYVGGIAPHKNLTALVDAVLDLRRRGAFAGLLLLIVGDYADEVFLSAYPALRRDIERRGAGGIHFLGALADETVAGLMRLSQALVLPSLEEGFGLPGIEAAACGAVVVATRSSALPEVLDDAAVYFDPADAGALTRTLERVLPDASLCARLRERAARRAAAHTWSAAADRLIAVFDELAGGA